MQRIVLTFILALALCACVPKTLATVEPVQGGASSPAASSSPPPQTSSDVTVSQHALPDLGGLSHIQNYYLCSVIDDTLSGILTDGMTDYERLAAVYRHLVIHTAFFNEPVGTDIWRYRGDPDNLPTAVEIRSISPLLFMVGSCEDYAAAFVTLCDRMGFEARYVPGLTYSVDGVLVDHAWAMVRLDGQWYHADPQLEDNVIRNAVLRYRYFLKSDEQMKTDHRWGGLLENPSEYALSLPRCDSELDAPAQETVAQPARPDRKQIEQRLATEKAAYLTSHPPLSEITLPKLPQ